MEDLEVETASLKSREDVPKMQGRCPQRTGTMSLKRRDGVSRKCVDSEQEEMIEIVLT